MPHSIDPIGDRDPLTRAAPGLLPLRASDAAFTIAHIGVGTFHRTHQAHLLDLLVRTAPADTPWRLIGLGLLSTDAPLAGVMADQDCVYSVVERSAAGNSTHLVSSISDYIHAVDRQHDALDCLAAESTRIVSLTVTEGGYTLSPDELRYEIDHAAAPRTWPGYLVEALARRRLGGRPPFTVLSCDNLPGNGAAARNLVLALAAERDPNLARWIAQVGRFPSTMVDRISPATTDEVREIAWAATGFDDRWPVQCEPYLEWRIEDDFVDGLRPAWDLLDGVSFVPDVHPYEVVKLRLLNLAHQAIAYPGLLLGLEFSHEAIGDPDIAAFLDRLMDSEVIPHVDPPAGLSLAEYRATVAERFANPHLGDTLERLATDSVNRLRQFAGPCVADAAAGGGVGQLALLVAMWATTLARSDASRLQLLCGPDAGAVDAALGAERNPRSLVDQRAAWSPILGAPDTFWAETLHQLDPLGDAGPGRLRRLLRGDA